MTLANLQAYWWIIIAVLGAALVFLLFVQGGQTMILNHSADHSGRAMIVNALGRKWELTFTTLVVFGGAFFASFPLFYSTSFGGAYWLWMLILFSFVLQAVSYEYRRKPGNIYGTSVYDIFLFINGCAGCILLGVAVAMMFFGAEFTVAKGNLLDTSAPVISQWAPTRGLEAIATWQNLLLGFTVLFLARTQAALFFLCSIADSPELTARNRRRVAVNGLIFVVLFLLFAGVLFTATGLTATPAGFMPEPYKYLNNLLAMPVVLVMLLLGVVLVLAGIILTVTRKGYTSGIWLTAPGTVLVVVALFCLAGFNDTPYYPSLVDFDSSLTIANSSSTEFTLGVMSIVSLAVPFVVAYIAYVWHAMTSRPITPAEVKSPDEHLY
ncbi:MAG: cytochrome d ubiquinol oxidase subunit II [Paramuribaculum sp.]|nr:cytochrome d ubiquinol oxidase subunit II [Paramuribaculum sp.]MDE7150932.1 cytochrome d ubiquinol oxidase subunit II [Candidatus Amulumruptor sp.]